MSLAQIKSTAVERHPLPQCQSLLRDACRPLVPTILCGGAGSRLWPVSRASHPKPYIRLSDRQSLLQKAFLRGRTLPGVTEVLTVTQRELFFKTKNEFRELADTQVSASFILEPFGRNTAPAIAVASMQVAATFGPDALMLVLPADHLIGDQAAFEHAVHRAIALAERDQLVTFGIQPDAPERGYGYIEVDGARVLRFVEKPSADKAKAYVESGRFLWNSGMFCFAAGAMLEQMQTCCPQVLEATRACVEASRAVNGSDFKQLNLDSKLFSRVPDVSIDYAVMEKSDAVAVVPCDIGWSDIGSWVSLGNLTEPDANANRVNGDALLYDTSDCTVQSTDRLVAAVGVTDLVIVDTPDAMLVAHKSRAQDVKHVYAELKLRDDKRHKVHRTEQRPWGSYTVLDEGAGFKIKRIEVDPGASLSLQSHRHRCEHWVVVSGAGVVTNGERDYLVQANESTHIQAGQRHRLANPGAMPLVMIEVQYGSYLGEDDIMRFEDAYGRAD